MSDEQTQPQVPPSLPVLPVHERRVLGVLVEKAKTTPDAYPLSLNALTTGCNQKSNRDPLLDLNDLDVEEALAGCQKKQLAFKITGSRVDRWKHNLYDAWKVNKVELAILGELLLRGAQTEGELRTRASRMEPIADLDALRAALKMLAERGLVVYLTPEGRRGTTLTHGMHSPQELERLRARLPADADFPPPQSSLSSAAPTATPRSSMADQSEIANLQSQIDSLKADSELLRGQLADLQATVVTLGNQVRELKDELGG
jgi:uncharacterized protein